MKQRVGQKAAPRTSHRRSQLIGDPQTPCWSRIGADIVGPGPQGAPAPMSAARFRSMATLSLLSPIRRLCSLSVRASPWWDEGVVEAATTPRSACDDRHLLDPEAWCCPASFDEAVHLGPERLNLRRRRIGHAGIAPGHDLDEV